MSEYRYGGCACGAVRYRAAGKPVLCTICHCTFCQRRLASAFAILVTFPKSAIEITQGELAECVYHSDESGRWLRMNFCARCGTTVTHTAELRPGMRTVAGGTFDERDWIAIDLHIWVLSKLPWVVIPEGVPTYEKAYVP